MTKHGWLVMGMAWSMVGCAETAASSTSADAATAVDVSADAAPEVDAGSPADAAPAVDAVPSVVDAGPACVARAVDVNAYATRSGGYSLRATAGARSGVGPCQTWQGGGDRWMRFTAPVAGLWRVSARGSNLWSFSAHRACEGAGTEVACRQFTDFHSSNPFTQPLSFDLELAAGESTFLLASGCVSTGCAWTVDIASPITVEGRCSIAAPASACRDGWFCRNGAGLPSGVGVCVEATPPGARRGQRLRVGRHRPTAGRGLGHVPRNQPRRGRGARRRRRAVWRSRRRSSRVRASPATSTASTTSAPRGTAARRRSGAAPAASPRPERTFTRAGMLRRCGTPGRRAPPAPGASPPRRLSPPP